MSKKNIIFWFSVLLVIILCACLSTSYDYDLFARLIVGEQIIEHGIMPYQDFLSYTPTHPWYDHEWGSGVIFYMALKYMGAFGFIFLYILLFFGTIFFIIKTQKLQKHAFPTSLIFAVAFFVLFAILNYSLIRCQLLSFFMFSIFLYILEKNRMKGSGLVWLIPAITVFWNNVHGGVVAGLGLVIMYIIGAFCERKPWKKLLAILILSSVLLIINPYGLNYLNFLFSAVTMERKYITEWWPFYTYRYSLFVSLFIIAGFLIFVIKNLKSKKIEYTKLIVTIITIAEGLLHIKLISLGLIAVASLCYNEIFSVFARFKNLLKRFEKSMYLAIFILSVVLIPLLSPFSPRVNFKNLPYTEVEFLKINNFHGNILVPFGYGSFVSYKLYPDNLIYMDGRYEEVYNEEEFNKLVDFDLADTKNWDDILKDNDTKIVMIHKTKGFEAMLKQKDWIYLFEGKLCSIFVRKDMQKKCIMPSTNVNYYRKNIFDSYFSKSIKKRNK